MNDRCPNCGYCHRCGRAEPAKTAPVVVPETPVPTYIPYPVYPPILPTWPDYYRWPYPGTITISGSSIYTSGCAPAYMQAPSCPTGLGYCWVGETLPTASALSLAMAGAMVSS